MKVKHIVLIIIILGAVGYLIGSRAYSGYYYMPMMYNYNYPEVTGDYNYFRSIALFVAIVAAIILFLISFKFPRSNTALEILENRLSKGEINIEEFKRLTMILRR